jgi:hypothetical protein
MHMPIAGIPLRPFFTDAVRDSIPLSGLAPHDDASANLGAPASPIL